MKTAEMIVAPRLLCRSVYTLRIRSRQASWLSVWVWNDQRCHTDETDCVSQEARAARSVWYIHQAHSIQGWLRHRVSQPRADCVSAPCPRTQLSDHDRYYSSPQLIRLPPTPTHQTYRWCVAIILSTDLSFNTNSKYTRFSVGQQVFRLSNI